MSAKIIKSFSKPHRQHKQRPAMLSGSELIALFSIAVAIEVMTAYRKPKLLSGTTAPVIISMPGEQANHLKSDNFSFTRNFQKSKIKTSQDEKLNQNHAGIYDRHELILGNLENAGLQGAGTCCRNLRQAKLID